MKQKKKKKMMMFFENVKHSECLSSLSLLARSLAGRDVDSMLERERDRGTTSPTPPGNPVYSGARNTG